MDDEKIKELEEEQKGKHANRTYNFFRPVGQFIEHVDTDNFSMDKDGNFQFENVGQMNGNFPNELSQCNSKQQSSRQTASEESERFIRALVKLRKEGLLIHKYDFTWVMEVTNKTNGMPKFSTPQSFITFLDSYGISDLPSEDSINKKQNAFTGDFPDWVFNDCDTTESTRRINVGKRFLTIYRNEK